MKIPSVGSWGCDSRHFLLPRYTSSEILVQQFPEQGHLVRFGHAVELDDLRPTLGRRHLIALMNPLAKTGKEIIIAGIAVLAGIGEPRQEGVEDACRGAAQ